MSEDIKQPEINKKIEDWIEANIQKPMPEIVKLLDEDKTFKQIEKYNIMWTIGVIYGKESTVAILSNNIYNLVFPQNSQK